MAMGERTNILMCPPDFYQVDYVINPWMEGNIHRATREAAVQQWNGLHAVLARHAEVAVLNPQAGLPDMVFTANAGAVLGKKFVVSRFFHRERRGEEPHFRKWFKKQGFELAELPADVPFEGAGDALMDRGGPWLWAAYGFRTELDAHPILAEELDIEVLSVRLVDPRFYHLDTCLCPLEGGYLLYYPDAFDARSNRIIEQRVAAERRIAIGETDAVRFACNAVNIGDHVVLNAASPGLKQQLAAAGFAVIETPLTEFMKAGGAAKCLTLRLTEQRPANAYAFTTVLSRRLKLEGHLLDSGLLERVLDAAVEHGGSFQILHFHLGKQRQSTSDAEIKISAPSEEVLDHILTRLIHLGAVASSPEEAKAELKMVNQPGVAPDDFYSTTIYPTAVRVDSGWLQVQDQRMDAVIVVDRGGDGAVARCRLFRQLQVGDQVVVGSAGIRTVRNPEKRDDRSSFPAEREFAFMGAGVSSERRVELALDRISWEMHRIRERHGRIIVVAGPVVVHTGGGEHLGWLVRNGYVQALLGGNGVATHDIEQSLLGTSLGVDMTKGASVHGGHQHHLRAINTIRRCGGIRQAVEQGVLTSGFMYDCVRNNVPFALSGSIRDDGPLPDTIMDLTRAQDEYGRLIKSADMILMLSSMLHSIGVGNMTPAGVKLVCVDINPAVVTKLSDRGSVESVGVVTDVGLFLNLLTQRLRKLDSLPSPTPDNELATARD
jgi:lysine-ketoglutarate reductase/saccharopine dehydrogenase-like protein (TIGR00300 family)